MIEQVLCPVDFSDPSRQAVPYAVSLAALVLGLAKILKFDWLPAVGLGGVLMVEYAWHGRAFSAGENPALVLAWYLGFAALFLAYPFFVRIDSGVRIVPWATAALSAPLHFGIIYAAVKESWPNDYMGLLPAALGVSFALDRSPIPGTPSKTPLGFASCRLVPLVGVVDTGPPFLVVGRGG